MTIMVPGKLYPTNYPNGLSTMGEPNQGLVGNFSTIVTLTAAQMLAFNANPNTSVLLIPTLPVEGQSSAGNVIAIRNVFLELISAGTAYTNGAGNALTVFHYGSANTNSYATSATSANMLAIIGSANANFGQLVLTQNTATLTNGANQSVYLNVNTSQFAAGTSNIKLFVDYSVIAL